MTLQDLAIRANFRESEKARQKEKNKAHVSGGRFHETLQTFSKNHSFQPLRFGWVWAIWSCSIRVATVINGIAYYHAPRNIDLKEVHLHHHSQWTPVYICLSNMQPHLFLETFPSIKWAGILSIQISRNQKMKLAKSFKKKHVYISSQILYNIFTNQNN